jgi:uncharacterized protein (UPF0332 family)
VSDRIDALIAGARTEIAAVRSLTAAGFARQAHSRAYYAAFYAAEAALLVLGETRSKHSGVIAAFGRLVIKDGGFDRRLGGTLSALFERRNAADYDWLDTPEDVGDDPAAEAERFVDAVQAWIDDRR